MAALLTVRMKDEDYAELASHAEKAGLPISSYARSLLLEELRRTDRALAREILDAIERDRQLVYQFRRIMVYAEADKEG